MWYHIFIVVKMKLLCHFIKSVSGHYCLYECNSKGFVFGLVQRCVGNVVIPEEHVETKECLYFFMDYVSPLWVWLLCSALFSITVCFFHNHVKRQELHASPHIEQTPILSYPYISIYGYVLSIYGYVG